MRTNEKAEQKITMETNEEMGVVTMNYHHNSEQNSREMIENMAAAEHRPKLQNKSTGQIKGTTDRIIMIKNTKVLEEITSCNLHTVVLSVLM